MHRPLYLGLVCAAAAAAQASITVGSNVHVSATRPDIPHNEVVIAADPHNAGRLLACSMMLPSNGNTNSAAYVSTDGGMTWMAPVVADEPWANDPSCGYGPDGTAYFIAKTATRNPRTSSDWDVLNIRRSGDGGHTWELFPGVPANDRPFMAVDTTMGPYRGRLYAAFNHHVHGENGGHTPDDFRNTIRLATSIDGGRSFRHSYDRVLMDQGGEFTASSIVGAVAVLSDGTVAVLHEHALMSARGSTTSKLRTVRSWLQLFLSRDGGQTLEPARKIADIGASTYNKANTRAGNGAMAVDAGDGGLKDQIYVVWTDAASGRSEVMFSRSGDRGATWSAPRSISDDQKSSEPGAGPDDFMLAIAVNPAGVIGVQWYDRRDAPNNRDYYVRFTASLDGGETWQPSVRVSEFPNAESANKQGRGFLLTGGDTAGLAADNAGVFHSLWIDNRTGVQQVWTAAVSVRPN